MVYLLQMVIFHGYVSHNQMVNFSGLSPEICPEATKTLKRPTMCLVSCMQMLTECSLWLFHASWVWGYDSCQVVSNSQNTDCVWLWVWQTSSKHIDDIASTECTEGSGKQPLIQYHHSLKGIPTPTARKLATSFQSVVATIWVCLKIVYPIVPNGFADHYPNLKWLFHWEY